MLPDRLQAHVVVDAAVAQVDVFDQRIAVRAARLAAAELAGRHPDRQRIEDRREAGRGRHRPRQRPGRDRAGVAGLVVADLVALADPVHAVGQVGGAVDERRPLR